MVAGVALGCTPTGHDVSSTTDADTAIASWKSSEQSYCGTVVIEVPPEPGRRAPIAVVLDSNAIWHQWWLTGDSWENLRRLVEQDRIVFYVSEVVVQEVARGRRHDANDLVRDLDQINLNRIERLLKLGLPAKRKDLASKVQELVADYDTELRVRLNELGAVIIPVPSVSHQVVLTRALEKRRPFDAEGRDGYRDVLIWHSLLDVAELDYGGIVFVTNNTSDFCTGKPPALLPTLADELGKTSPETKVLLATTVAEVGTRVEEVERLLGLEVVTFKRPGDDVIRAALAECIDVIVAGTPPPTPGRWGKDLKDGWPFHSILEEDPIDAVSIDLDLDTLKVVPDGDSWEEFTATVLAEVTLDGFAFKADYYVEDQVRLDVQDADWNNHYMHVWEYHDADLTFRLTLNEDGTSVEECWLEEAVERLHPDDHHVGDE